MSQSTTYHHLSPAEVNDLANAHAEPLPPASRNFYRDGFKVAMNVYSEILLGDGRERRTAEQVAAEYWVVYFGGNPNRDRESMLGEYRQLAWIFGFVTGFNYAKTLASRPPQTPVARTMSEALKSIGPR